MLRAVYGGSFNPVHCGHMDIVQFLVSANLADEVLLLIAGNPPHKTIASDDPEERVLFLQEAVAGLPEAVRPKVSIDDTECRRPDTVGYTIDQLVRLDSQFPSSRWSLVIGMDSLFDFTTWKDWPLILSRAALWVAPRFRTEAERLTFQSQTKPAEPFTQAQTLRNAGVHVPTDKELDQLKKAGGQIQFLAVAPTEVSSTQLRRPGPAHWRQFIPAALHNNAAFRRRYQLTN